MLELKAIRLLDEPGGELQLSYSHSWQDMQEWRRREKAEDVGGQRCYSRAIMSTTKSAS